MLEDSTALQTLTRFGYLALMAGSALENAAIVLVAGILAECGVLSLPLVLLGAFVFSALGGQGLFLLSRYRCGNLLVRFPKLAARADNLCCLASQAPGALRVFALLFRWCWGLKNLAPLFLGRTAIGTGAFSLLNLVGAAIWSACFSLLGYGFAKAIEKSFDSLFLYEIAAVALLVFLPAVFIWRRLRKRRLGPCPNSRENATKNQEDA